jgi:hypothetical protein
LKWENKILIKSLPPTIFIQIQIDPPTHSSIRIRESFLTGKIEMHSQKINSKKGPSHKTTIERKEARLLRSIKALRNNSDIQ